MQQSAIRDNHYYGSVGEFLTESIDSGSNVSIVSAYFTIYAYERLREKLEQIQGLRFLFGEPTFISAVDTGSTPDRPYMIEDDQLLVSPEHRVSQSAVAQRCADWIRDKAQIKSMIKPKFLHGKMYHIHQAAGTQKAIGGSSNFTVNGLGLGGSSNIELNLIVDNDRDRDALKEWFDLLWNNEELAEDVKNEVLKYIEQLYRENSPEFVYFKTLYHLFYEYIRDTQQDNLLDQESGFLESQIWNALYDFQKDGVRGAISKINTYSGCVVADSVGLGKTYEALAVIKYYELLNQRVLVVVPKKLSNNWTIYQAAQNHSLNPFPEDRFGYTVLYHTDLTARRKTRTATGIDLQNFNWGAYDLVVVDESHNLRGNPTESTEEDGTVRLNRAMWLMKRIIKEGKKTKVLLLSATPVNNTLRDLRNQIYFISEGRDTALADEGIHSIAQTLNTAQKQFTRWAKDRATRNRTVGDLLENLDAGFFTLLDRLTIARSRRHITTYYDINAIGSFPRRSPPLSVYSGIDLNDRFPTYERLDDQIREYRLAVFNPSAYVQAEHRAAYGISAGAQVEAFSQERREHYLIGMMKVNFLKRLESSIHSFKVTLDRTIKKIDDLRDKITGYEARESTNATSVSASDLLFNANDGDGDEESGEDFFDEQELDSLTVGKSEIRLAHIDLTRWKEDLAADRDALVDLYNNADAVSPERDAKLAKLKTLLKEKADNSKNHNNAKALVFTAFSDTAWYLYENLKDWYRTDTGRHIGIVTGSSAFATFGRSDYDSVLMNFAPRAKRRDETNDTNRSAEIDLLIATDCISEGQNLQDCDYLINYDIHWNPVRIIQRFGRIDRIGSTNESIQLVNFWPTEDLDNYINLKTRVEARMALVDVTATGQDNVLRAKEINEVDSDEIDYRDRQLKRLQSEVLDLEDLDDTASLTDFTLDDFRMDLLRYLERNEDSLRDAPEGLYAVAPAPDGSYGHHASDREFSATERETIRPGAIFCLRSRVVGDRDGEVNPLAPYALVYVYDTGEVRYTFTHTKQILQIFSRLAAGQSTPYRQLCDIFNSETDDGNEMEHYEKLVRSASAAIETSLHKRATNRLVTGGRSAAISKKDTTSDNDGFELITWLVIR